MKILSVFRALDNLFDLSEAYSALCCIEKPQRHILCQLAPPDNKLGGKCGHQVDFCTSPRVGFRTFDFRILRLCEN